MPCLRTVGNIVTGSHSQVTFHFSYHIVLCKSCSCQQTQAVVQAGVLPYLTKLLESANPNVVKEASWTVSNIAAGTVEQIQLILEAGIVPRLVHVLRFVNYYLAATRFRQKNFNIFFSSLFQSDFRAQMEACWAITNITIGGETRHITHLCEQNVIPALCNMLTINDWKTVMVVMDGLENILKVSPMFYGGNVKWITI